MVTVRFSDTDSFCFPPGLLGKGRVAVCRKEKKDECGMLAHFSIIPLFGHFRLMEGEEVRRKAHECF